MHFNVGQKVACVKEGVWCWNDRPVIDSSLPKYGEVHTVIGIGAAGDREYIFLKGYGSNVAFWASNFRPIQEKKTDISVFEALLNTTKAPNQLEPVDG
jgi:hypothetical protein